MLFYQIIRLLDDCFYYKNLTKRRLNGRQIPTVALAKRISSYLYKYQELLASAFIFAGYDSVEGFQVILDDLLCAHNVNTVYLYQLLLIHVRSENSLVLIPILFFFKLVQFRI